jgi:hypothetical protein
VTGSLLAPVFLLLGRRRHDRLGRLNLALPAPTLRLPFVSRTRPVGGSPSARPLRQQPLRIGGARARALLPGRGRVSGLGQYHLPNDPGLGPQRTLVPSLTEGPTLRREGCGALRMTLPSLAPASNANALPGRSPGHIADPTLARPGVPPLPPLPPRPSMTSRPRLSSNQRPAPSLRSSWSSKSKASTLAWLWWKASASK